MRNFTSELLCGVAARSPLGWLSSLWQPGGGAPHSEGQTEGWHSLSASPQYSMGVCGCGGSGSKCKQQGSPILCNLQCSWCPPPSTPHAAASSTEGCSSGHLMQLPLHQMTPSLPDLPSAIQQRKKPFLLLGRLLVPATSAAQVVYDRVTRAVVAHGCVQYTQNLEIYSALRHVSCLPSHMTLQ